MVGLNHALKSYISEVLLQTKHTWCEETFWAHFWFQGGIWHDWVFIDLGKEHGILPNKIMGFINLSALPRTCHVYTEVLSNLAPLCMQ
jgi:hypothetical protein